MSTTSSQYSLRRLFVLVSVAALAMSLLVQEQRTSVIGYFVSNLVIPTLIGYCGYDVGRLGSQFVRPTRPQRVILRILGLGGLIVALYVLWAWFRVSHHRFASDPNFPRAFPYPDLVLMRYHDYLDQLHPVAPGFLKLHGEFPRLHQHLNVLAGSCVAITAMLLGLVLNLARPSRAYRSD